jgi:hypothetical protein
MRPHASFAWQPCILQNFSFFEIQIFSIRAFFSERRRDQGPQHRRQPAQQNRENRPDPPSSKRRVINYELGL